MVALMAVLFLTAGFYLWLRGHWYLRVLVFLGLVPFGVCLGAIPFVLNGATSLPVWAQFLAWPLGTALAWLASGIPLYVRRYRLREASWNRRARLRLFLAG